LAVGAPAPALWDLQTRTELLQRTDIDDLVALSLDGRYVLLRKGSNLEVFDVDRHLTVSTLHTRLTKSVESTAAAVGVGFSSDASRVVINETSGEHDRALVAIFDAKTGERVVEFSANSCNLSRSHALLAASLMGRVEVRRVDDGKVLTSAPYHANADSSFDAVPSDDGQFLLTSGEAESATDVLDATTGRPLARYGGQDAPAKFLRRGMIDASVASAEWLDNSFISPSGGFVVWPFHLEERSPRVIDEISRSATTWRVVNGALTSDRAHLRGTVSLHGHPTMGAAVTATSSNNWHLPFTTVTDPHGHYELELPDGPYTVSAQVGDDKSVEKSAVVSFRGDTTLDLDLN
jgi:hypothetical protein